MIEVVHIAVVMKSSDKSNFAEAACGQGVAGLNVNGCRIEYTSSKDKSSATPQGRVTSHSIESIGAKPNVGQSSSRIGFERPKLIGRFPANVIHDGSKEVVRNFPRSSTGAGDKGNKTIGAQGYSSNSVTWCSRIYSYSCGSAARFFKELDWLD